jgi:hypothetical protein
MRRVMLQPTVGTLTVAFLTAASRRRASHCGIFACIALNILSARADWSMFLNRSASTPLARSASTSHWAVPAAPDFPLEAAMDSNKVAKTSAAGGGRLGGCRPSVSADDMADRGVVGEEPSAALVDLLSVLEVDMGLRAYHGFFGSVDAGAGGLEKYELLVVPCRAYQGRLDDDSDDVPDGEDVAAGDGTSAGLDAWFDDCLVVDGISRGSSEKDA